MQDWKAADVGDWWFRKGTSARLLVSGDGRPAEGALVHVTEVTEDTQTVTVVPVDGAPMFACLRTDLVPELDWANVPEPWCERGAPGGDGDAPNAFFLSVFGQLKQVSKSIRTGDPILRRSSRIWGWFANFPKAFKIVDGNVTDIQECCYEFAMIEEIPPGMCRMDTRQWWWVSDGHPPMVVAVEPPARALVEVVSACRLRSRVRADAELSSDPLGSAECHDRLQSKKSGRKRRL